MAPMDENLTTRFSWNDTRVEIGAADVILLSEQEWNLFNILGIAVAYPPYIVDFGTSVIV